MHWFIGIDVKNSIDIMVEATSVNTIDFTFLETYHSSSGDISLTEMVAGVTVNFRPSCTKYFSSGVSSFLERLINHLSLIQEVVEEVVCLGGYLVGCFGGSGDKVLEFPGLGVLVL